jgi:hypothetical protein
MAFKRRVGLACAIAAAFMLPLEAAHAQQSIAVLDCTLIDDNAAYNDDEIKQA